MRGMGSAAVKSSNARSNACISPQKWCRAATVDARLQPLCGSFLDETCVRFVRRRPALDQIGLGQRRKNIGELAKPRRIAAVDDDLDAGIQFLIFADFDVGGRAFAE